MSGVSNVPFWSESDEAWDELINRVWERPIIEWEEEP